MLLRKQENNGKENKSPFFVKAKKNLKQKAKLFSQKRYYKKNFTSF